MHPAKRPYPTFTGSVWICPVCAYTWHTCDCAEGEKCRAPNASTHVTGRGARHLRVRR